MTEDDVTKLRSSIDNLIKRVSDLEEGFELLSKAIAQPTATIATGIGTNNPNKPRNVKCPKCGGEMVSRTSKHGVFWGCKDYPKCDGTRDSMGRSREEREAEKGNERKSRTWTVE